jgi:DNA primase
MATIPEQIIERIREQTDIVDVVGRHVGLKRSGKQFKGLCPFHDEKSPSFYVDPARRSYKCFGCGEWGDVFDFVQKVEGVGFLAAVRSLGAQIGVALPDQGTGDLQRAEQRERERELAYRINATAADLYRRLLTDDPIGELGRAYQQERRIDSEIAESFRIGYAPAPEQAGWDTLVRELQAKQLPLELADELGLIARSQRSGNFYDRFRGRLMFPIIQPGGRVIGFSGRVLPAFAEVDGEKAPKYVNSSESLLYKKSKTLFGLHAAANRMRERERGILVEGQIDVVAMHQRGFGETVAPLGTALTKPQVELLARFTDKIVLCFDGDRAGTKAAYAALPVLLEVGMDVRIAALEPGEDPDSTAPEKLDALLAAPGSALEWFMRRMVAKGALQSIDAQGRALRALIPLLRSIRRSDVRGDYATLASQLLRVPLRRVWTAVESGAESQRTPGRPGPAENHHDGNSGRGDRDQTNPSRARASQFSEGMPHSAAMRPAQPLPSGQANLTALLIDRPELARLAKREEVLGLLDELPRRIVERVLDAAIEGRAQPSEGELLDLADPAMHRILHGQLFAGLYREDEDPKTALHRNIKACESENLRREIAALDRQIDHARSSGDDAQVHELTLQRVRASKRQQEISTAFLGRGSFPRSGPN